MNWDDKSDSKVNSRLADLLKVNVMAVAQDGLIVEGKSTSVDYCNSWSDMGPLIAKYRIGVEPYDLPQEHPMNGYWFCLTGYGFDDDVVEHKNPLRAAAICLIKKLEADNAKV